MKNLFDIKDRVIVVTGATGVLAGATARYLAECGAKVAFIGRNEEKLAEAQKFCDDNNLQGIAIKADVMNKADLISARDTVLAKWGTVDCLVNGAGGNKAGAVISPDQSFFDLDLNAWEDVFKLNMEGTLLPTIIFGEIFQKNKKGSIVNFSSMTAQLAVTRVLGYSNAKASIDNLTKWLSVEFAKKIGDGVRVNAVAPGFFLSEQNRTLLTNPDGSLTSRGNDIINATPFARFGDADEVFGAIHYLCSDASKFVTGTVMAIDGGFSCFSGV
jgi:NAD(P)-dependent dehydrogenase (short-subunit alcohol dehydrogenase family)